MKCGLLQKILFVQLLAWVGVVNGFSTKTPDVASSLLKEKDEVDVEKAFAASSFPISPEDLIARAKEVLSPEIGIGTKDGGNCLADNFEFCAAVIGPLGKEEYLEALGSFKLEDSFDIYQNSFGFTVSPVQPNRVYWFNQQVATMTAPFMNVKTISKDEIILPPQCLHMDFDDSGKVIEFGFYTVDRRYGNTDGLGGAFGYFKGAGMKIPIPEFNGYKPSFRLRMFHLIGKLGNFLSNKKKS